MDTRRARVVHTIGYRFAEAVFGADLVLRLTPRALASQRVSHHQVLVEPRPTSLALGEDERGNGISRIQLHAPFRSLEIRAVSTIERPMVEVSPEVREAALELLSRCGAHPLPHLRRSGPEACRERAEVILARLREHGVEGRYVAGYPWLRERGSTLPHAWTALLVPGHGWVDFDGTRGEVAPGHIVLGRGRSYEDVAPVAGTLQASGRYRLVSSVVVEPLS